MLLLGLNIQPNTLEGFIQDYIRNNHVPLQNISFTFSLQQKDVFHMLIRCFKVKLPAGRRIKFGV